MKQKIKRYADAGDITSLKYIFMDALDVDPTFERYKESYDYCRSIPGLLEQHRELTPFERDTAKWTEDYWVKLKMDLKENFSDQRMNHMRSVAKVLMAEKVQKIMKERETASTLPAASLKKPAVPSQPVNLTRKVSPSKREEQKREKEESREQLEKENRRIENERKEKDRELQKKREALKRENQRFENHPQEDMGPKKAVGIALAAAVVAVVLIVLILK